MPLRGNRVVSPRSACPGETLTRWLVGPSSGHPFALLQAEVYDTPGGDLALEGVLHATLRGFSVHARILRSRTDGERDGIPVITVLEAELVGASLCPEPADLEAIFTRACDLPIEWQLREEAEER
jgi:hypothetical protein